jgi:hypothetical protein
MNHDKAVIATREAPTRPALRLCGALLVWLAACSADSPSISTGLLPPPDAGSKVVPGFDGFGFDANPEDSQPPVDAATDVAVDAPDDTTAATDDGVGLGGDGSATDGTQGGCSHPCESPDQCNQATGPDAPCIPTTCELGCCHAAATSGDLCDDGQPCNGPDACKNGKCTPAVPSGCDDGLPCTADKCDYNIEGGVEKCVHTTLSDWCHIGKSCVQGNTSIPGNPCKICDPGQDQDGWSYLAGCCQKDADCVAKGQCDKPTCDVAQGACLIVKIPGCCKSDADCDDGNPCTTDTCDGGSGNCTSTPITCPGSNECQTSTCDPVDGVCKPDLAPGWCYIDGECISSSGVNPNNPCQICEAYNKPLAWSSSPGTFCSDDNPCTFSDVCTAAGTCKGTLQPGCCKTNADCDGGGVPCKIGQCNTSVGLCATVDKPGCCTAGVCCDAASQTLSPAGTSCASNVIGSDYQCSGADVQQRDYTPGCNGFSATSCTSSMASGSPGPWATISTCPANTACMPQGSGIQPSCVVQGSCAGACGTTGTQGCKCSSDCLAVGTCCGDATSACGCTSGVCCDTSAGMVMATGTPCGNPGVAVQFQCSGNAIQQRSGQGKCTGSSACSTATADVIWDPWQTTGTCPANCVAAADGSSASCQAPSGSCLGSCGQQSHFGPCSCAASCKAAGTCCADYDAKGCAVAQACFSQSNTCAGACGGYSQYGSCFCDDLCNSIGDCCPDKFICGCSP